MPNTVLQVQQPFCQVCNRSFCNIDNLNEHIKSLHCSYCGKGFKAKRDLQGHIVIHTGIHEFKWQGICPQTLFQVSSFTSSNALKGTLGCMVTVHIWVVKTLCFLCHEYSWEVFTLATYDCQKELILHIYVVFAVPVNLPVYRCTLQIKRNTDKQLCSPVIQTLSPVYIDILFVLLNVVSVMNNHWKETLSRYPFGFVINQVLVEMWQICHTVVSWIIIGWTL